ncbi:hypothetical protein RJ640_008870 [Escallonia rubra]|uniref:S-adenosyl-L-methionine-dependent methyltransferase n=1 Tax=Escallonia rubra TaxID=112253 RepID=A0AA88U0B0_9ASTE|nr:hypothetical protein RJ640_008870 [Escallonia rubra]
MKEDRQPPLLHHHHRRLAAFTRKSFTKSTAYVVILVLISFVLGYLSAASYHPRQHSQSPTISQTTIVTATAAELDHYRFTTQCADPVHPKLVRQTVLDRVFNGTSPYASFPPPHISPLLRESRIKGWGSNGAVFGNLIRKVKPETIIEVGTFLGASAINMARLTRELGLKTQILCVDDFRGWPGFLDRFRELKMVNGDVMLMYQFMQNVVHVNSTESVLFVPFQTGTTLDKLCEWGVFGDLVEVDAGHDFHSAWIDINRAYKVLRPGGVMFGHDYFTAADNRGVRRAVNLFAKVNGFRVKIDGQHWVIDSA